MMRLFLPVKQALILAGRGSDRGPKEKEAKLAERPSPVQKSKAKISYNINVSQSNFVDTPNNWVSDSGASIELHPKLRPRQADSLNTNTDVSTCGYLNGNAGLPRTANPGFDCRVDTKNAIWGFCPTTILAVSDCGLVGGCVDLHACSGGCGIADDPSVTTFTCADTGADYCSTALLTDGPDQTYSYIACGGAAITDNLLNSPTTTSLHSSTSSTSALSGAKPSVTSASSTSSATSSSSIPTTSTSSLAAAPSSTLTKAAPSSSNNTGAIVGGVLGGLALLAFVVVAILFYRRRRISHINGAQNYDPLGQDIGFQRRVPKMAPRQAFPLAELPSDSPPAELSNGRHDETAELPNDIGGTSRV